MAVVATYPKLSSDWLRHELDPRLFREEITIPAGTGELVTGTVLGKITANGKHTPHVNGAVDGTETAVGILLDAVDASGASDVKAVMVSGHAEIVALLLTWHSSVDDTAKKDAALAQLLTLDIKTRKLA